METMYMGTAFSLALDAGVELAETPIWDQRIAKWYWTDLFKGDVHRFDPASGAREVFPTGKLIGAALLTTDVNRLLLSLEDGLHLLDLQNGGLAFLTDPENGNPANRYNDTRVDSRGRVFMSSVSKLYGTPAYTPDQKGGFYMVDTDGSVRVIEPEINQFNAMVWNGNDTRMFVVDTFNQTLLAYAYDIGKGPIGPAETVLRFDDLGMPDGISIDVEDTLYICHWTGTISVWDKNLQPLCRIPFPVEYACCGGFGGPDMRDFLVASSKYCYSPAQLAQNPGAGGLFLARSAIQGRGDHLYRV